MLFVLTAGVMTSQVCDNLAMVAFLAGRLHGDDTALDRAEWLAAASQAALPGASATHGREILPRILIYRGRVGEVLQTPEYLSSLKADPYGKLELGLALWQSGDEQSAFEVWRETPNLDIYFLLKGMAHESAGELSLALTYYSIGFDLNGQADARKGQPLYRYGELLRKAGDRLRAIAVGHKARESGYTIWADRLLGLAYLEQRDYIAAEQYFREAQRLDPSVDRADFWVGLSLAKQGRNAEAIDFYKRGLATRGEDGLAHYELARAYLATGQKVWAREHLIASLQYAGVSWDSAYMEDARKLLDSLTR